MALGAEEVQIGKRIRLIRKEYGVSRRLASEQMGISQDQLKRIELGEVAVRFFHAVLFCQFADLNPLWLAFGEPEKRFGFFGVRFAIAVEKTLEPGFLEVMKRNRKRYSAAGRLYTHEGELDPGTKIKLGRLSIKHYLIPEMTVEAPTPTWNELRSLLVAKTQSAEAKVELASRLGVTLAAVSQWRSGASAPTADNALRILNWIKEIEAQQKESTTALTAPRNRSKLRKSGLEKSN